MAKSFKSCPASVGIIRSASRPSSRHRSPRLREALSPAGSWSVAIHSFRSPENIGSLLKFVADNRDHNGRSPKSRSNRRLTDELRDRLDEAAQSKQRPVSEEIELRLENSFFEDRLSGGAHNMELARLIALTLAIIERQFGGTWQNNFDAQNAARMAIRGALEFHFGTLADKGTPERREAAETAGIHALSTAVRAIGSKEMEACLGQANLTPQEASAIAERWKELEAEAGLIPEKVT
jgi:hypothetical protein